jgi:hypothetical protein
MVTASVLLPGMQTPSSSARATSAARPAAAAAHAKPRDIIYMRSEETLLNTVSLDSCTAAKATGHCKAAHQRGMRPPLHCRHMARTQSTRDTQGNCIFVSNALSSIVVVTAVGANLRRRHRRCIGGWWSRLRPGSAAADSRRADAPYLPTETRCCPSPNATPTLLFFGLRKVQPWPR